MYKNDQMYETLYCKNISSPSKIIHETNIRGNLNEKNVILVFHCKEGTQFAEFTDSGLKNA